ncbi:hypothetical protein [Rodentibacter caecimuris]|uniref:hypothetical protein n=1 Tax=Rodentibacter caecimuris TaxID=1796644 RepID=UPI0013A09FDB|nr:hypothetical protein [Rodentibacter heylii]QIA76047.1 hypothetical protein FEE42_01075 [Rodentibacter heylii]
MTALTIDQLNKTVEQLSRRVALLENNKTKSQTGLDMNPQAIWTPKHIAKYSGFSYGYIRNHLINAADFPKPIQRNTGTARQRKLYLAGEIIQYFSRNNKN